MIVRQVDVMDFTYESLFVHFKLINNKKRRMHASFLIVYYPF